MGGKIEGYVDCASPYSYFALKYLRDQRELLKQHNVEIDFHPFFLGGVNVATGNKPPSTVPAKGAFGSYDLKRACNFFNTPLLSSPPFFPMLSLLPQRSMIAIKSQHPLSKFESVYEAIWVAVFQRHLDLAQTPNMRTVLLEHFDESETDEILRLAGTKEVKEQLNARTKEAVERGAFGAPWFWMTNDRGEEEPLFGSDRWSYMFRFLGVPVQELRILEKGEGKAKL